MNALEPREVEWNAPWHWAREALALMARRPVAFGLASLGALAVFFAAVQVDSLMARFTIVLLLPPLSVLGFMRLAEAADRSLELPPAALLPSNGDVARILGLGALGYALAFGVIMAVGGGPESVIADLQAGGTPLDGKWKDYVALAVAAAGLPLAWVIKATLFGASLTAFAGLLLVMFSWFTLPLIHFSGLGLVPATLLSVRAYRLNARRLGVASFALLGAVVLVVVLSLGLAAMLIAPFIGAVLYVSFRDVFLGRRDNEPARARQALIAAGAEV